MYKQAVIHYPKDERMMTHIRKEMAAFHCTAAVKYMDILQLNAQQKVAIVDTILSDIRQDIQPNHKSVSA